MSSWVGRTLVSRRAFGGENGMEVFYFNETMIVRVEVIHFSVEKDVFSLITTAVRSLNAELSKYDTSFCVQEKLKHHKEVIEIDEMLLELMQ